MGRTRTSVTLVVMMTLLAVAGNALRAGAPRTAGAIELSGLAVDSATAYVDEPMEKAFLDVLRAREVLYRTYEPDSDAPVWVFLGYFDQQKEGSQVHSPRHCYPGSGWNIESEPSWPAPWGDGEVRSLVVHDGVERRLVLYWYQLTSRVESDVLPLKIELARRAMVRDAQDVVFASISTRADPTIDGAMTRLTPYARSIHTEVARLYRERNESDPRHR